MKFFSYICNCVALDTGMCANLSRPPLLLNSKQKYNFAENTIHTAEPSQLPITLQRSTNF